jgi:hypothetical protein
LFSVGFIGFVVAKIADKIMRRLTKQKLRAELDGRKGLLKGATSETVLPEIARRYKKYRARRRESERAREREIMLRLTACFGAV